MRILLCFLVLCCMVPSRADNASSSDAIPKGLKVALTLDADEIIPGGIENDAHRCGFEVRVSDGAGKPQSDVPVPLPEIVWPGYNTNLQWHYAKWEHVGPAKPPVLRWNPEMRSDPMGAALTDANGVARGEISSGNVIGKIALRLAKSQTAPLVFYEQVDPQNVGVRPYGRSENGWNQVEYKPEAIVNGEWVAIHGHHYKFWPRKITLGIWEPTAGRDDNRDGKPDGGVLYVRCDETDPDNPAWQAFLRLSKFHDLTEVAPGIYRGRFRVDVPYSDPASRRGRGRHIVSAMVDESYVEDSDCRVPSPNDVMPKL